MSIFGKLFGDANTRLAHSLSPAIEEINKLEKDFESLSLEELKDKTQEFKKSLSDGESLDDILPEAFALVREAAKRTLGQRHYDVQLMGGIVLHHGKISEMKTGEGKTLVATLPVFLNALNGNGVHVVTVNDYLARRDAAWMGQIYHALGLTVGVINHESSYVYDPSHISKDQDKIEDTEGSFKIVHELLRPVSRREAYAADITYGTNNEFGFDYLRDNMVYGLEQMVQRGHHYAIVDEVDSILIDEARTPLIISAPDEDSTKLYETFARIVPTLIEGTDYSVDEKDKAVNISESGIDKVEERLGMKNLYDQGGVKHVHHLEQALKANSLFKKDKDYVVKDGEIIIVDEFTGRLMPGRRWSEGLHQAVEAKEGVAIQKESRTLATITFQNYFRLYKKLAGMTGTAQTSAEEFHKVYKLEVVSVPTHQPMIRKDLPDRIYKTEVGKYQALIKEIQERHQKGQPILIGTSSVEKNEQMAELLKVAGIPHAVLNAKNHEQEAEITAQAGRPGAVTLATNIAGRGVDIILGGNPPDSGMQAKARELGGLHVLGTERHEARRIDDQLRGRSGRQGDPGSSQFFISTEDELVRIFGGDRLKNIMDRLGVGEEEAIENRFVSNAIQQAQSRVEGRNFDYRKYILEFDDVMNKHRTVIYDLRRQVLNAHQNPVIKDWDFSSEHKEPAGVKHLVLDYLYQYILGLVNRYTVNSQEEEWNLKEISDSFKAVTGTQEDILAELEKLSEPRDSQIIIKHLIEVLDNLYSKKEAEIGKEDMRKLENILLLRVIDEIWIDHLVAMDHLKESVSLRAYGQRDPLAEYKVEGQRMFQGLIGAIQNQVINLIFKVSLMSQPSQRRGQEQRPSMIEKQSNASYHQEEHEKIGRNDLCPCGSGLKWKRCGLLNTEEHQNKMETKKV
ncbi:MAG TPA: preprotein translocase subunit SecA [Candidatus Paceibacterota bacterium]